MFGRQKVDHSKPLTHREIMIIMSSLMTGMLLAALDQTIVSTALKSIVEDFNGLNHYSWVVTAYLLTSTASTPLYGKISDLYGRRPVYQFAIVIFLIGSFLAGASTSMEQLIATRALQGLGAGGLMGLTFVIVGDLVIDYLGALLLVIAVSSILIGLSVLGPENGWTERRTLLAIIGGLVVAALFVIWEGRAVEPILPLELFKNRTFTLTSIIGFIIGAGMFGAIIMLPLYLQIIQGNSATSAGLKLIPLMLGILTFTVTSGRMITKTGRYKVYPVVGTVIMSLGIFLMSTAKVDTPYWQIAIFAVIIGGGLGLCMQTIVIALQNAVDFKDLGIATSSNTFFRTLGGAFGTAIFGTVLSDRVAENLENNFADFAAANPGQLAAVDPSLADSLSTNTEVISTLPIEIKTIVLEAFSPLQDSAGHASARQDAAGEALG